MIVAKIQPSCTQWKHQSSTCLVGDDRMVKLFGRKHFTLDQPFIIANVTEVLRDNLWMPYGIFTVFVDVRVETCKVEIIGFLTGFSL